MVTAVRYSDYHFELHLKRSDIQMRIWHLLFWSHDHTNRLVLVWYSYGSIILLVGIQNFTEIFFQIDFVPTFSLLLGLPIPFSNLGSVIPDALTQSDENFSTAKQLQYVGLNLDQGSNVAVTFGHTLIIDSQLSRCVTARGSGTGLSLDGPT